MTAAYRKLEDLIRDLETSGGRWRMDAGHEVSFQRRRLSRDSQEQELGVRGQVLAAEPEALVLAVTARESPERKVTGLAKLEGRWQLDARNRITFSVKRPLGKFDKLTFQGAWHLNGNHEIVYTYQTEKREEGRGKKRRRLRKQTHELVFQGTWRFSAKNCLTYSLGVDSESAFRIRGAFQTPSILAKDGEIRYQLGAEWKMEEGGGKKDVNDLPASRIHHLSGIKTITFFGKWKFSRSLALSFELDCADGKKRSLEFGAAVFPKALARGLPAVVPDEIAVNLKTVDGKRVGCELVLTKKFWKDSAQAFLSLSRDRRESLAEAGVTIPW